MDATPGTGHNRAPYREVMDELLPNLPGDLAALNVENKRIADDLVAQSATIPAVIESQEDHDKAAEIVSAITKHAKVVEAARNGDKAPPLEAGRKIDGYYAGLATPMENAKKPLSRKIGDYLHKKAEDERRAREAEEARKRAEADEARRKAAELEQQATTNQSLRVAVEADQMATRAEAQAAKATKAAEAKPADLARTRTATGTLSTLKREWVTEIVDVDKIDLNALRGYFTRDEIEKAVRGAFKADHTREIAGAKHYEQNVASIR